jgi:molybdopterin molybdotransferase
MEKGPLGHRIQAVLGTSINSTIGLEEYVRVRIEETTEGGVRALPVFGKSGMLSTMVKADGIVLVPMNAEGFSKGKVIQVIQS